MDSVKDLILNFPLSEAPVGEAVQAEEGDCCE